MKTTFSNLIYAVTTALLLTACSSKEPVLAPEQLYNAGSDKVICSFINDKAGTISIIYGNEQALKSSSNGGTLHYPGERYTLVTWKQKPMPHWYGTDMNGTILSVERVEVQKDGRGALSFIYSQQRGHNTAAPGKNADKEKRISFITSQLAAVFP
ncbi:hypothetical protein [Arcticibacter sp. MXS-1]|uniref:hypothetical protein n=1 Tax=Arcticibacter sp. MXS-1 TaxID=3341726 RepID=UPI0035A8EDD8